MMKKRIFLLTLALALLAGYPPFLWAEGKPPAFPESPVTLQEVLETGLMSASPDGTFHPEKLLSRAELAVVLVKTFDLESRPTDPVDPAQLKDVPSDHWAYGAIRRVVGQGVMTGYREGRFYPDQKVSRAEGFSIFAQAFGVYPFRQDFVSETLGAYADRREIPRWAEKAMATAVAEGFVNVENGKLRPLSPMTRGDMAYALSWWLARKKRYSPPPGL